MSGVRPRQPWNMKVPPAAECKVTVLARREFPDFDLGVVSELIPVLAPHLSPHFIDKRPEKPRVKWQVQRIWNVVEG